MASNVVTGPWIHHPWGTFGSEALVEAADYALARLRELGVPRKPQNRLERARDTLRAWHEERIRVTAADAATARLVGEAIRTAWEIQLIARAMQRPTVETLSKIEEMLGGADLAADDTNPIAWNTQFELYVAALFTAGDVPVRVAEPDLRFLLDGLERGLALKRLTSPKKRRERAVEAAKQLEAAEIPGLVVINVDCFLTEKPLGLPPGELGRQFDAEIAELHRLLPTLTERPYLMGALAVGTTIWWSFDRSKPRHDFANCVQFRWFVNPASKEARRLEGWVTQFGARVQARLGVTRVRAVRRGQWLTWATLGYNCLEGLLSIAAGLFAGSVALIGFGVDSFIEVTASLAAIWRLRADADARRRAFAERWALRVIGVCFLALAVYIVIDATRSLLARAAPGESLLGIGIAAASLIVMPLLARAKREVGRALASRAIRAEARQTDICMYLSAILLGGLGLNALLGSWWADPIAALAMVPFIAWEGSETLRGRAGCDDCLEH